MTKTRKERERRKKNRRERLEAKEKGGTRIRRVFTGQARSGDATRVELKFTGREILIDPEHPEQLGTQDAAAVAWARQGHAVKGEA